MKFRYLIVLFYIFYGCHSAQKANGLNSTLTRDDYLFSKNEGEPSFPNGFFGAILIRSPDTTTIGIWDESEHLKFKLTVDTASQVFFAEYIVLGRNPFGHEDTLIYILQKNNLTKSILIQKSNQYIDSLKSYQLRMDTMPLIPVSHEVFQIDKRDFELFKFRSRHFNDDDYYDNIRYYGIKADTLYHYWVPDLGIIKLESRNRFTAFNVQFSEETTKRKVTDKILEHSED